MCSVVEGTLVVSKKSGKWKKLQDEKAMGHKHLGNI